MSLFLFLVRIVNSAGETPKDVARRFGRLGCIAILGGDSGKVMSPLHNMQGLGHNSLCGR